MVNSHTDFVLPGLRDGGVAVRKVLLNLAWASSYHWNSRRLENHLYGPWILVLLALTWEMGSLTPVPQYMLWGPRDSRRAQQIRSISAAGNITVHERETLSATPDFAIIRLLSSFKQFLLDESAFWHTLSPGCYDLLEIVWAGVPILIEVKRGPRRTDDKLQFLRSLTFNLLEAQEELHRAAIRLFSDPRRTDQKSVILIAVSGDWWMWRIATREATLASACNPGAPVRTSVNVREDADDADASATFDEESLGADCTEQICRNVDHAMCTEQWSKFIKLWSPASNQRFYLLHRYLENLESRRNSANQRG